MLKLSTLRNNISTLTIMGIQHCTVGLKDKMTEKQCKEKMSSIDDTVIYIDNTRGRIHNLLKLSWKFVKVEIT